MRLIEKLLLTISIATESIASIIFPTMLTSCNNKNESSNKNEIKEVNINYEYETIKNNSSLGGGFITATSICMKITSYRINEETRYLSTNQQPIIGRSLISKLKSLEEEKKYKFTFGSSNITLTDFYFENEKMINKY